MKVSRQHVIYNYVSQAQNRNNALLFRSNLTKTLSLGL